MSRCMKCGCSDCECHKDWRDDRIEELEADLAEALSLGEQLKAEVERLQSVVGVSFAERAKLLNRPTAEVGHMTWKVGSQDGDKS